MFWQGNAGNIVASNDLNRVMHLMEDTIKPVNPGTANVVAQDDVPFVTADQMPEYPGGRETIIDFMAKNVRYPAEAVQKGIAGKVFVQFVVSKDGDIVKIKAIRGIGGGCDEEAMRVVRSMPAWKPGRQNGKPVNVFFTLPVVFSLKK